MLIFSCHCFNFRCMVLLMIVLMCHHHLSIMCFGVRLTVDTAKANEQHLRSPFSSFSTKLTLVEEKKKRLSRHALPPGVKLQMSKVVWHPLVSLPSAPTSPLRPLVIHALSFLWPISHMNSGQYQENKFQAISWMSSFTHGANIRKWFVYDVFIHDRNSSGEW